MVFTNFDFDILHKRALWLQIQLIMLHMYYFCSWRRDRREFVRLETNWIFSIFLLKSSYLSRINKNPKIYNVTVVAIINARMCT